MTQDYKHPITPPPELVEQWMEEFTDPEHAHWKEYEVGIATRAAQWGADQELEVCCEWIAAYPWLDHPELLIKQLRAARRPKPPSLKEQALALVEQHEEGWRPSPKDWDTIRRALEALDD
jgi:hypothetical protein